ncbi:MAG: ankyrin repeat domain-containing protein [Acidobacteria bacterium]|nr:ankyrin repeat domain-containing protein [Acidobacteriota bacterium]MDA1236202.1 ankyrin repeat domain-containing protein [Acidobacteriota bacterium]
MHSRIIGGLLLLGLGLATSALAASLVDAAEQHDVASVRALLETGADVNLAQVDGTTALHWAAFHDDAELVALLLKAGAAVNTANLYGVPPLAQACINGNAAIVKLLLEAGADANAALKGGETVLMLAARSGNTEAVQALLASGANPNSSERLGQTVLMWAAAEGQTAVVRALIQAGADINASLDSGFTPFFFAVREGRLDVVREFISAGVDVNAMLRPAEGRRGRRRAQVSSPLLLAVQNAHFELALALVDAGADPNDVRTGFTPLHMIPGVRSPDSSDISDGAPPRGAGSFSSADFVREIVKRGADVNFRLAEGTSKLGGTSSLIETSGATPLLFAADRADVPLMRLLLELGADPLLPNFNGTTPFLAAAGVGTQEPQEEAGVEAKALEAVQLMLDHGADVNAVNNDGDTAMHGAAYNMYPLVIELLAERGADPQVWKNANAFGRTPLFIAEGHSGRLPRPDAPTIEVVTRLMLEAGLSLEGKRPEIIDIYAPKPAEPAK